MITTRVDEQMIGERIAPVWRRILDVLADGEWHAWSEVVDSVTSGSGCQEKTISNLLHRAASGGAPVRRGRYHRDPARNTRAVRLLPEPTHTTRRPR